MTFKTHYCQSGVTPSRPLTPAEESLWSRLGRGELMSASRLVVAVLGEAEADDPNSWEEDAAVVLVLEALVRVGAAVRVEGADLAALVYPGSI